MATPKIFVGYTTRLVEEARLRLLVPEAYPDPKDKSAEAAARRDLIARTGGGLPYTCTFDNVVLSRAVDEDRLTLNLTYADRQPGGSKTPICVAARTWILSAFPEDCWTAAGPPRVLVVGFDPHRFLRLLAAECSLPEHNSPLHPYMHATDRHCRDVGTLLVPPGSHVGMAAAIRMMRPVGGVEKDLVTYDREAKGWTGPHVQADRDATLATELSFRFGLYKE